MANTEIEAAERVRSWPSLQFSFVISGIWPLLLVGLVFRLILQTLPDFESDIDLFQFWAVKLAENSKDGHPWNFYDSDFFTDYAPGYMYVLMVFGYLHQLFNFSDATFEYLLKTPATTADLASVYLLWRFLDGQRPDIRYLAAGIYLVFPPALLVGPVWGQVDSILAFFLLLSIHFIARDRPIAGAVAYTVGFLVKPQAIAVLPFLAIWVMKQNPPRLAAVEPGTLVWSGGCLLAVGGLAAAVPLHLAGASGLAIAALALGAAGAVTAGVWYAAQAGSDVADRPSEGGFPGVPVLWARIVAVCLGLLLLAILPFFVLKPWDFVDHLRQSAEVYKASSFWAYNFWGVVVGMDGLQGGFFDHLRSGGFPFINDDSQWFGIDYRYWGITLTVIAIVAVCAVSTRAEGNRPDLLALGTAISVLAFYLFMTRMHERYLFPMFLPMLAACAIAHSRILWVLFVFLAVAHFLNLYYVYWYYRFDLIPENRLPDTPIWPWLYDWIEDRAFLLSLLMAVSFPVLLGVAYRLGLRPRPESGAV